MKITYKLSDKTKTMLANLKFQAQLKLTLDNLGFLGTCAALVVLGAAPAFAVGYTLI